MLFKENTPIFYKTKSSHSNNILGMGLLFLVIGLLFLTISGNFFLIGFAVLQLIVGFSLKDMAVVVLHDSYLEFSKAVLSSKKMIKYDDITRFEQSKHDIIVYYDSNNSIKISSKVLSKNDVADLIEKLNKIVT